jgi:4-hydroxy-4-methyl-2-oxoglutarate aldolase
MLVSEMRNRMSELDTPTVSDALDALGLPGAISGIGPVWNCGRIVGRVQTMQLGRVSADGGPASHHLGATSIDNAVEGDVIVVDNRAGEGTSAGWGGLLALAASLKKLGGVVVYGACRDVDDIEAVKLPVYAQSVTPRTARSRTIQVSVNQILQFDELIVAPGDFVIADRSGVVFIPRTRTRTVLQKAEEIQTREQGMAEALRQGASVLGVLSGDYESMLERRPGQDGKA